MGHSLYRKQDLTSILKIFIFLAIVFGLVLYVAVSDADALTGYHLLAKDNCGVAGQQKNLLSGDSYSYPETAISVDMVDADAPERTVAFGQKVVFGYSGLAADAAYKLRVTYLSDSDDRVQKLVVGDKIIQSIELAKGKVFTHTVDVPANQYQDGQLKVSVLCRSGQNAVVSGIELWADKKTDVSAIVKPKVVFPEVVITPYTPLPTLGDGIFVKSLNGTWRFNPAPTDGFFQQANANGQGWANIQVPGQWVQQGFDVRKNTAAGYWRQFSLPGNWAGKRIKLRFDAVYSDATVWVNGRKAGTHMGGFTPFELDVTEFLKQGNNTLALSVRNDSLEDVLASGSKYAVHPLGGISRKVLLFAVPQNHVASAHIETTFDKDFDNAMLKISLVIANEGTENINTAKVTLKLKGPDKKTVRIKPNSNKLSSTKAGSQLAHKIELPISSPMKWDCEHPNLYTLVISFSDGRGESHTIRKQIGFRQIDIRGNQIYVNGRPIKLRGICRHEAHPLIGRSLTDEQWRKDAELFREANVNFIRTSHYPPAEEFIEYCDRLGLFVESEAPFCWVDEVWIKDGRYKDIKFFAPLARANLEMVEFYRDHPSVIIWSLANESCWSSNFAEVLKVVEAADPTRPTVFHNQSWGKHDTGNQTKIVNHHYPGPSGPAKAATLSRPLLFGEYCHLNGYNRHELITDPGLRDEWGRGFASMWNKMYATKGCLGGAIWSAVDDTFHLPSGKTVGYGAWGPVDGWRRMKPEYWHVKKVYSPVRIFNKFVPIPNAGDPLKIQIENRHDFTNINELRIEWSIDGRQGKVTADIPPRSTGHIRIKPGTTKLKKGEKLSLNFFSPQGFLIDTYQLSIGQPKNIATPLPAKSADAVSYEKTDEATVIKCGSFVCAVDAKTGLITQAGHKGYMVPVAGPNLMILPLNKDGGGQLTSESPNFAPYTDTCTEWQADKVQVAKKDGEVVVTVSGRYKQASGTYTIKVDRSGMLTVDYHFTVKQKWVNPRQTGIVFNLPADYDTLSWNRKSQWTVYPDDHIGRPVGTAKAFVGVSNSGIAGPRIKPNVAWYHDTSEQGTNDFRSTKMNIYDASLTNSSNKGLSVVSDGTQDFRAWLDGDHIRMLIADYSNAGAETFFKSHAKLEYRPLKKGSVVKGSVKLLVID